MSILLVLLTVGGCATAPSATRVPHASGQVPAATSAATGGPRPVIGLVDVKLSPLLTFDDRRDLVFVDGEALKLAAGSQVDPQSCLVVPPGVEVEMRVDALTRGRAFPGPWGLIGLQLRGEAEGRLDLALLGGGGVVSQRTVAIDAAAWRWCWLDLPAATTPTAVTMPSADRWRLRIRSDTGLRIDTLALGDNRREIPPRPPGGVASLSLRGTRYLLRLADHVAEVPSREHGSDGFAVEEFNDWRARFVGASGSVLTIDRLGRRFDGSPLPTLADIEVLDEIGRPDVTTPGDRDNDGFDESRGTFRLRAAGPRLGLTISPRTPLDRPWLEVADLPGGEVVAQTEGRLAHQTLRLSGGDVLIELPLAIDRPIGVDIRVRENPGDTSSRGPQPAESPRR